MKTVLAVLAGFAVMGVVAIGLDALLSQVFPEIFSQSGGTRGPEVLIVTLAYTLLSCALGGYVAAWLSTERAMPAAYALGAVITAATIANLVTSPAALPLWWKIAGGALCGPITVFGGWLRSKTRR